MKTEKQNIQRLILPMLVMLLALLPVACIEDGISTSPSNQPIFSVDTLDFGERFSEEMSSTMRLMVYNRYDKVMSISDIGLEDEDGPFYLNVDGQTGERFSNIEIRPNDSIFVLVSAKLPAAGSNEPLEVESKLQFLTNGVKQSVVLKATALDAVRLKDYQVLADESWGKECRRIIQGSLHVAEGATLTLEPGVTLYFYDKASMEVDGRLVSVGTVEAPIELRGSRIDNVLGDISFNLMSNQWDGMRFTPKSSGNKLEFTSVCNTTRGIKADTTDLMLTNCRLRNSGTHILRAKDANITAVGCEFAEAASSLLVINGGVLRVTNCTASNYYLFSAITGPAFEFIHTDANNMDPEETMETTRPYVDALIVNSIIYGSMTECNLPDLEGTNIEFNTCLMRSSGEDDDHFINMIWGEDPLFYTVRNEYIFDYRLKPESPAIGKSVSLGDPLPLTDFYGAPRSYPASLGAYEPYAAPEME